MAGIKMMEASRVCDAPLPWASGKRFRSEVEYRNMKHFFQYSRYLFVLAHPDDEIYTCAFIHQLVNDGMRVDILFVTSGDYQSADMTTVREEEARVSMRLLNVDLANVHFMRVPERQLLGQVRAVRERIYSLAMAIGPECIVGHDFEGGHNGHDALSFCSSRVAEELHIPLYVFPAYHGVPEARRWNQFVSPRAATDTLNLSADMQSLQRRVMAAHASQSGFFDMVSRGSSYGLFTARELLRFVSVPINYVEPPTIPVGYEFPGSALRFADFRTAIGLP
jgi:LmbE family N-acetylglucosaminyl deacetylase